MEKQTGATEQQPQDGEPAKQAGAEGAPLTGDGHEEPDYKALYEQAVKHSREWERKAKNNKQAADELDSIKRSQMSEADLVRADLDAANAKIAAMEAQRERAGWEARAARETGLDPAVLEFVAAEDEEDMLDKARSIARLTKGAATAPVVLGEGTHPAREKLQEPTAGDFLRDQFIKFMH